MPRPSPRRAGLALALALLAGCGADGDRGSVSGTIALDGKPLESGSINFAPAEGTQSPSAGAAIEGGKYEIPRDKGPMAGAFTVTIRAPRKTGKKVPAGSPFPPGTMVDETVEAVPAKFNVKSELRREVKAGSNTLNFELTSR